MTFTPTTPINKTYTLEKQMRKEKVLRFTTERGAEIHLPLKVVAEDRAKYYAAKDKETTYEDEFNFVMEDDYEGIDWFQNNMNACDVIHHFEIIREECKPSLESLIGGADMCLYTPTQSEGEER